MNPHKSARDRSAFGCTVHFLFAEVLVDYVTRVQDS